MNFFIGPMSKNIVDTVIYFAEQHNIPIIFIPSRRQIEYNGGYVNGWTTETFSKYVKEKSSKILIERDHSGAAQGINYDDGYESLKYDSKYFDIIHIDPWKAYSDFDEGLKETEKMIRYCYNLNNNLYFEIGTEEAIRKFETEEIDNLIFKLKENLPDYIFNRIKYIVIQCGTKLLQGVNNGIFDSDKLTNMLKIANKYNLIAKEHNGDWVSKEIMTIKEKHGLNNINIAPEFGEIETKIYIKYFKIYNLFEEFYNICFNSNTWKKWIDNIDLFKPEENKEKLVSLCGHYVFNYPEFLRLKEIIIQNNIDIDNIIRININNKLEYLYL